MKNPRRPLLIGGLCLLGAGLALYVADGLPAVRHWLMLAGALVTLLYFVLARAAKAPGEGRKAESMLYEEGQSTMMDDMSQRKDD